MPCYNVINLQWLSQFLVLRQVDRIFYPLTLVVAACLASLSSRKNVQTIPFVCESKSWSYFRLVTKMKF